MESIIKNQIKLQSENGRLEAIISPEEGGRLVALKYADYDIIKATSIDEYGQNFASAILFPFANRVNKGSYEFEGKTYQLKCNENLRNNALHGLVFDKKFRTERVRNSDGHSSVELVYQSDENLTGFPFSFKITLNYSLNNNDLSLGIAIENTDTKSFPFTLGWHPYFYSNKLKDASVTFNSKNIVEQDSNQITSSLKPFKGSAHIKLGSIHLDNAYELNDNQVIFLTPDYKVTLDTFGQKSYLQLFTPEDGSSIAIEPMTGVSNSFNNNLGLKVLRPNEVFHTRCALKIEIP